MAWTPNSPTGTGNIKTDLQNTAENIELLRKNFVLIQHQAIL